MIIIFDKKFDKKFTKLSQKIEKSAIDSRFFNFLRWLLFAQNEAVALNGCQARPFMNCHVAYITAKV